MKIGIGYDTHILIEDRKLVIGGVAIPYDRGLLGYSDADVLIHAIMDSILGALGEKDIGCLFPDDDDRFEGISSLILLEKVSDVMKDKGYTIGNIDSIIIAEKPKMNLYTLEMKKNIARCLNCDASCINIKATTTEKMGPEGEEKCISAQSVCLLCERS